MKRILAATTILALTYSVNAYADVGKCGFQFEGDGISLIAHEIGVKAFAVHEEDFKRPSPKQNRTMPWTLDSEEDIAEFVEDILRKRDEAKRDRQTVLVVETKELTSNRTAWWEDKTGTFVVYDPGNEDCGTAYRPDRGKHDYDNAT